MGWREREAGSEEMGREAGSEPSWVVGLWGRRGTIQALGFVLLEVAVDLLFVCRELNLQQLNMKVMKADYHGSILRVWRSKCPNYVGTEGILIQETQNTLRLIVKENKMKSKSFMADVMVHML